MPMVNGAPRIARPLTREGAAGRVSPMSGEGGARIDRGIVWGLGLTPLWLGLALAYVSLAPGWTSFVEQPPSEIGSFLEGAVAPLAFLWLVLGLFLQQGELSENSR